MDSIKAVVFDFGNVISCPQPEDTFRKMSLVSGIPEKVLEQSMVIRAPFDGGDIDRAELYRRVLSNNGFEEKSRDRKFCERLGDMDLASWFSINEETCTWIRELKASGYKTGILSNMPRDFLELYGNRIPVFKEVDYALFSCDIHIIKPNPEIYKRLLEGLGVMAEETVFFDDLQKNIDAANEAGIHGIVFTTAENAKLAFKNI